MLRGEQPASHPRLLFYQLVFEMAEFVKARQASNPPWGSLGAAIADGGSLDAWLAVSGPQYGLPDTTVGLRSLMVLSPDRGEFARQPG